MSSNQLKAGALISYIQMGLAVAVGLVYTPVMLRVLGPSEYGLYNTVVSTVSILSVLSLGFNSSYIRYFAKYKVQNDDESIYKLNGMFLVIFIIIGVVAFICGLFLTFNLDMVFDKGLVKSEYALAEKLMFLLTINLSISFPMSVFQNIIAAYERYIFLKILGALKTVVGPLVSIPLLIIGCRSVGLVVVTLSISFFTDILYIIYSRRKLNTRFYFKNLDKRLFRDLIIFTFFIALNLIVDQVNVNVGKFLLGRFNGTNAVAVYTVGFSLYQYYMTFSTSISGVFAPRIHKIVNETKNNDLKQKKQLTDLFVKVGRIQFEILFLIASGLILYGKEFIRLWAGTGFDQAYEVMVIIVIPATVPLVQNIGIEIQRALNRHQFRSLVYILMSIVNIVLTIYLCPRIGVIAPAIGTAFSTVVANCFVINIYYHKMCNVDVLIFWKNLISLLKSFIVPIIVGIVLKKVFQTESFLGFIASVMIYTMVYCISVWRCGLNQYEKELVMKICYKAKRLVVTR